MSSTTCRVAPVVSLIYSSRALSMKGPFSTCSGRSLRIPRSVGPSTTTRRSPRSQNHMSQSSSQTIHVDFLGLSSAFSGRCFASAVRSALGSTARRRSRTATTSAAGSVLLHVCHFWMIEASIRQSQSKSLASNVVTSSAVMVDKEGAGDMSASGSRHKRFAEQKSLILESL